MSNRSWSAAEIALLREHYPLTPAAALARRLRRKLTQVHQAAARYGIRKDPDFARALGRLHSSHPRAVAHRFPPGHVPANKGLRRPGYAPGRMRETQFKKGDFPVNRDPDFYVIGALRVNADGYIDMRISFAPGAKGWRALHLILWEDAHGPLPPGHAVVFKNRDRLDVELGNLELITRAELMRRNTIHHLPPALKATINALGRLKRRIREKQDRRLAQPSV